MHDDFTHMIYSFQKQLRGHTLLYCCGVDTSALRAGEGGPRELLPGVDDGLHLHLAQLRQRQGWEMVLVGEVQRVDSRQGGVLHHGVGMRLPDLEGGGDKINTKQAVP